MRPFTHGLVIALALAAGVFLCENYGSSLWGAGVYGYLGAYKYPNLNQWACDFVNDNSGPDEGGCYDTCIGRAEPIGDGLSLNIKKYDTQWVNACAIVINGAEY